MTKNEIISELFISKDFNNCISKMKPVSLQDELKAEVALILCEIEEEKIIDMYNRGYLKYFTVRIILNQIQSNTSPFYKKFRIEHIDICDLDGSNSEGNGRTSPHNTNKSFKGSIGYFKHGNKFSNSIELSDYDTRPDEAIEEIETLYWYDREILKLYGKLGTYRAIEEETGIPFESIYKTVQKACKEIRKKVA